MLARYMNTCWKATESRLRRLLAMLRMATRRASHGYSHADVLRAASPPAKEQPRSGLVAGKAGE
jgi:hypothetical protein